MGRSNKLLATIFGWWTRCLLCISLCIAFNVELAHTSTSHNNDSKISVGELANRINTSFNDLLEKYNQSALFDKNVGKNHNSISAFKSFSSSIAGSIAYVKETATGSANGADWDNAYGAADLETALVACLLYTSPSTRDRG